jgi:hypothetical protein
MPVVSTQTIPKVRPSGAVHVHPRR